MNDVNLDLNLSIWRPLADSIKELWLGNDVWSDWEVILKQFEDGVCNAIDENPASNL